MNCTLHPDVPAAARCEHCGRLSCAQCSLDVVGNQYCVTCVAERMRGPQDPIRYNGNLLFILSFVPGLGHLYLGLRNRGLQLALLWLALGWVASVLLWQNTFGLITALAAFYSLFDTREIYHRMQSGVPVPDRPLPTLSALRGYMQARPRALAGVLVGLGLLVLVRVGLLEALRLLRVDPVWIGQVQLLVTQSLWAIGLVSAGVWLLWNYRKRSG